jgi:GntR family transcriptional regulator, transcriptional repressor for pyruvate dehydrogenase complex
VDQDKVTPDATPEHADRVRAPKAAERIAARIRRRIVRGEIKEGDTLLPESELMAEFGVSRPTLREAFRLLESESLISVARGARGGARVHSPDIRVAARYAGVYLQHAKATLEDLLQARAVIEPLAARTLAERCDLKAAADLRELIVREREAAGDIHAFGKLATAFYERLMELAGNQTLAFIASMLHDIAEMHVVHMLPSSDPAALEPALRSQEILVDLIVAGDAARAEVHWRAHVRTEAQGMLDVLGRQSVIDLFD